MRLALATAIDHVQRDFDLAPLLDACAAAGIDVVARAWDDPSVEWSRFDVVLVRSTWDYTRRLPEFLRWCRRVAAQSRLLNEPDVLAWNTDKHYLRDLQALGVAVVPTQFVDGSGTDISRTGISRSGSLRSGSSRTGSSQTGGSQASSSQTRGSQAGSSQASSSQTGSPGVEPEPLAALQAFLAAHAADAFVVKPAVGAGSHDAQRYTPAQEFAAANHLARLLDSGRDAMLQPYLDSVDRLGETGLLYFNGVFSHAIGKDALLRADADAPPARSVVAARTPGEDELALAQRALDAAAAHLGRTTPFVYARVDLLRDATGAPCLLELELCEPSLFLAHAPGAAARFAQVLAALG